MLQLPIIEDLITKSLEDLSGREIMARKCYLKKIKTSGTCQGFFGVSCTNSATVRGLCGDVIRRTTT